MCFFFYQNLFKGSWRIIFYFDDLWTYPDTLWITPLSSFLIKKFRSINWIAIQHFKASWTGGNLLGNEDGFFFFFVCVYLLLIQIQLSLLIDDGRIRFVLLSPFFFFLISFYPLVIAQGSFYGVWAVNKF